MPFVDTNVLLYSLDLDRTQPAKAAIATEILARTDLILSVQVLQEFYVQATHLRRPDALPHDLAAAQAARCRELLSEDLNHGQDYDGVRVVNPFK